MKKINFFGVTNGKFTIKVLLLAVTMSTLLLSCGGGNKLKKPLVVKPTKINLVADFDDNCKPENKSDAVSTYMEIVDSTYSLTPINDGKKLRIDVMVKSLKKANENDEFELSDYYSCGRTYLFLVDDIGTHLMKSGTFLGSWDLVNFDAFKEFLKNNDKRLMLRFEIYTDYMSEHLKTPETIKGFVITSSVFKTTGKKTEAKSTESPSTDVKVKTTGNAGNENWDSILNSYEKYINQYIALMKKAKNGDASAMTEYPSMMEKATDFADKLENASDDLSPTQTARFLKLQTKLTNAAAGL
jgi:hypothetical protein